MFMIHKETHRNIGAQVCSVMPYYRLDRVFSLVCEVTLLISVISPRLSSALFGEVIYDSNLYHIDQ